MDLNNGVKVYNSVYFYYRASDAWCEPFFDMWVERSHENFYYYDVKFRFRCWQCDISIRVSKVTYLGTPNKYFKTSDFKLSFH